MEIPISKEEENMNKTMKKIAKVFCEACEAYYYANK
jgi:hypothetical protein